VGGAGESVRAIAARTSAAPAAGRAYGEPLEHPLLKEALAERWGDDLSDQGAAGVPGRRGISAGQAEALRRAMTGGEPRADGGVFGGSSGTARRHVRPETTAQRCSPSGRVLRVRFPQGRTPPRSAARLTSRRGSALSPRPSIIGPLHNQPMGSNSLDALGPRCPAERLEICSPT